MNGVADAFVHVMEQYLTYPVDAKVQDAFSESLLKILISESRTVKQIQTIWQCVKTSCGPQPWR